MHEGRATADMAAQRRAMVAEQLVPRGIKDPRVLKAMETVPREHFVPEHLRHLAYADDALPIGHNQTISQPYVVALMTEALALNPTDRVLEIGTGSGYQAAILSLLAQTVYTVERLPELAEAAKRRFAELGYHNIHVRVGDGYMGWPEHAPYDGIVVTAAAPEVPAPLLEQLADGGRLVIPVGPRWGQTLFRLVRRGNDFEKEPLIQVTFVPLISSRSWMK